MTKKIKIKFPHDNMKISEIEEWLNEMALDGLSLVKIKQNKAVFIPDESKDVKYRIIYLEDNFSLKRWKEYLEHGYDRVAPEYSEYEPDITIDTMRYYTFKCTEEKGCSEIHGDELTEEVLLKIYKKNRNSIIMNVFASFALIALCYLTLSIDRTYNLHTLVNKTILAIFTCIPYLAYIFALFGVRAKKDKIMEYMDCEPVVINNRGTSSFYLRTIFFTLFVAYTVYAVAGFGSYGRNKYDADLRDIDTFVSILDIEDDENIILQTTGDFEDCYTGLSKTNFIITEHYTIYNYFKKLPDASYDASVYYDANYYETQFGFLTELAYNRWVERHGQYVSAEYPLQYTQSECFDTIVYKHHEYDDFRYHIYICFVNENVFFEITYEGKKTPEEIINIVDKICSRQ